ncbi:hypothetical protein [Mesorhizobium delmotii]|uniref:hypothetical protein n=1 Tax=Mesorhizobium delmotii TaxID=1631247 RepID=UPI001403145B|nr:hypothetical protein [Mesorhizobium delmotii]
MLLSDAQISRIFAAGQRQSAFSQRRDRRLAGLARRIDNGLDIASSAWLICWLPYLKK